MSDLAAAARILADLAQALDDEADDWPAGGGTRVRDAAAALADGDPYDGPIAAALLAAARRKLLAVPEITCPACSATIRARLADQPGALATTENADDPDHCGDPAPALVGRLSTGWCIRRPGHGVPHRDRDGAEWTRHETPRTLTEADLPLAYELCAQVCESESATVAGGFLGQLRDLLGPPTPRPRVWLTGDEVPAGVAVLTPYGTVLGPHHVPWLPAWAAVEVPDFGAAVAAEQARRAATDGEVTE